MTQPAPSICLSMIVKNEASVITRCLDSVLPLITHWVIVDTGSTDGTQKIIKDYLKDVPGTLYERPWKDFAHNRTEALQLAKPHGEFSLVIDADDVLELPPNFVLPPLTADSYTIEIRDPPAFYLRTQLVRSRLDWLYRGVLHEFIATNAPHTREHLAIGMRRNHDGDRRKDPKRFDRDAEIFEKALKSEKDNFLKLRYTFYLAQSYRDAKQPEKAITHYLERAKLGGWIDEVYYSLYQVAKLKEFLGHPVQEVIAAYDAATRVLPHRIEAIHGASRLCRLKGLSQQGYDIAKQGLGKALNKESLFSEPWIYETGMLDEFAVNAYWVGQYTDTVDACLKILATGLLSGNEHKRVVANARYAWDKLSIAGSLAVPVNKPVVADLPQPVTLPAKTQHRHSTCPLCDAKKVSIVKHVDDAQQNASSPSAVAPIKWLSCDACGHIFTESYPTKEAEAKENTAYIEKAPTEREIEHKRIVSAKSVERVSAVKKSGIWLDYGEGDSSLLLTASEWGYKTIGLDRRKARVEALKKLGMEAHCRPLEDYKSDARIDVISLDHLIDHIPFPKNVLAAAHRLLGKDGLLVLSTANYNSPAWRLLDFEGQKPHWDNPERYHHFSKKRLYDLLREKGFEPVNYMVNEGVPFGMEIIAKKVS